jgi:cytochrome c-type biogenesis protein CcmE
MTEATPELSQSTGLVRRRRALVAIACCVAAIVAIIVLGVVLSENVLYFQTVSEAVRDRSEQGTDRLRLAGEVVPGSVTETSRGVRFEVTDGTTTAEVVHRGDPPDLFEDAATKEIPVVCEGHWGSGQAFASDRILIRHGNEYTPPKVEQDGADGSE